MDEIIHVKSTVQLYRLISRENLHLRGGFGRDDALLKQLAKKLTLDPSKPLPKQLETKKISLEAFVQAFFSLTEPFSEMLNNIYSTMQRHEARSASRSLRMRFSFKNTSEKLDFDLKHFREWLAIYRKLRGTFTVRLWSQDDINKLFQPIWILKDIYGESYNADEKRYSSPLPEPKILYVDSRWAPLRQLRDAMEQLRQIASRETDEHARILSILTRECEEKEQQMIQCDPSKIRLMLSDFWPGFARLLSQLEKSMPAIPLTRAAKDALEQVHQILSDIQKTRLDSEVLVRDLIELLRLPFWKHRWRVYEVWVMFEVISCLDEYNVTLDLIGDRLTLEEYTASKIAHFEDSNGEGYEVWTQLLTPVDTPHKRKSIMPDLRLCKPKASVPENTLLLVECKQRKSMKPDDLEDLIEDYRRGACKSILNLFVNYDAFPPISSTIPQTKSFSNINPAYPLIVQEFKSLIRSTLKEHRIEPAVPQFDAIVFDVSGSMEGEYATPRIGEACRRLLNENPRSKISFFSSNLLATEKLSSPTLVSELEEMISGSTNLDGALRELHERYPGIKRVAVVTDGNYDGPVRSRDLFQNVEELIFGKNFPSENET